MHGMDYVTLDVFTDTPLAGNQLAIVLVPRDHALRDDKQRMQAIAREFNYSETVFLHEVDEPRPSPGHGEFRINIFTLAQELPFAGHPTIGTAWYLAQRLPELQSVTLLALAGPIAISYDRGSDGSVRATAAIPYNVHQHATPMAAEDVLKAQPRLRGKLKSPTQPVVSVVKGMTFALIEVNSLERLSQVGPTSVDTEVTLDAAWSPSFCGTYFFFAETWAPGKVKVHTRMIEGPLEDPATGSAASTLAAYLSLWSGRGDASAGAVAEYEVIQGADMGRPSRMLVKTTIGTSGQLSKIELSGTAVKVMQGVFNAGNP